MVSVCTDGEPIFALVAEDKVMTMVSLSSSIRSLVIGTLIVCDVLSVGNVTWPLKAVKSVPLVAVPVTV